MININKIKKPVLIAEIGINHNGSVKLAKKMIDLAKDCGFDFVKFQKKKPRYFNSRDPEKNFKEYALGLYYLS